jgi:cyclophilin family peptidyl-prolyl cis-trans isomerase
MRAVRRGVGAGPAVVLGLLVACQSVGVPQVVPSACPTAAPTATEASEILADATTATVETSLGSFTIDLVGDAAPIATANFVALARCGFYEGITFHRVLAGFVAQAGDPNTRENRGDFEGLGTSGPGYGFPIELPPDDLGYDAYTVAMANDRVENGSQFFICLTDINAVLPTRTYSIFGVVTESRDVVDAIGAVAVNDPLTGVPVDPVVINRISVEGPESTPQ